MSSWISHNWEKVIGMVLTATGSVYAAWRSFSGRVKKLEADVSTLRAEVTSVQESQKKFESTVVDSLEKIGQSLSGLIELRAKNDAQLDNLREDVRELRSDIKELMRR